MVNPLKTHIYIKYYLSLKDNFTLNFNAELHNLILVAFLGHLQLCLICFGPFPKNKVHFTFYFTVKNKLKFLPVKFLNRIPVVRVCLVAVFPGTALL